MKRLLAAACALMLPAVAGASTVVIWPVDPTISGSEPATAIWLENKGDQPVTLQVRTFLWSQTGSGEALVPQDEIVASPPIATVAPGKRQLVRVIRRAPTVVPERSYRLLVDELPDRPPEGGAAAASARLAVQMRYSIPLFSYATTAGATSPGLIADVLPGEAGSLLSIRNGGTMHARLSDIRMARGSTETMIKAGLAGYVLPGATITFPLPAGGAGAVRAVVNGRDAVLTPSS
ncbi:molecular chaperone [Sphingomonas solaris]|uniref:Molecular chaperone n=1 Tax=Alterirhizorhabdus solaris TaxID=2529389 RepID=A0A558QYS1_9SPHN|nr:fimbria/pilus periplasmic chaperone [Sphingomonas solaris]TVV72248.1 molecular chaperone [Sphingomonas solaris]